MALLPNLGLLLIDIQEKLFAKIREPDLLLSRLLLISKACQILEIPTIITQQYPQGLGPTIEALPPAPTYDKTTFSCLGDAQIKAAIVNSGKTHWIVAGIESHVCVLQTVRDLIANKMTPIVLQDAISSRNILDHTSALQEMRTLGARVTTTETLLFELLEHSKHPHFKEISRLIK